MNTYDFEATDFALSPEGLHLLRSRYNYKTIRYQEIEKATVKRASEYKNTMLCLILGILLVVFALFEIIYVIQLFLNPRVHVIYIESILLPILPGFIGIYLIYIATKKGPVLIIESGSKKRKLRLRDFTKDNKIINVISYLGEKLSYKISIQSGI